MQTQERERITHDAALNMPKGSRGRRGRKDSTGDEQVLKVQPIKDALAELTTLAKKAQLAATAYNDARKKVAERSNANSAQLNKLIKASLSGRFEDVARLVQQQAELFEAVGEVAQGAPEQ